MNTGLLKLILLITTLSACSQKSLNKEVNFIKRYHPFCNAARHAFEQKNYEKASILFQKAFSNVKHPFWIDLYKAIEIEVILDDLKMVEKYALILALSYAKLPPKKYFDDNIFYDTLAQCLAPVIERTQANFNTNFITLIDSLVYMDQRARKTHVYRNEDSLNIDSLNTCLLIKAIHQYDFPSAYTVGIDHYYRAMLILLHADFDIENELLNELMLKAVKRGQMRPHNYASIIDRRCNFRQAPFVYHEVAIKYDSLSRKQKRIVTNKRKKIGLRPVEKSFKIEKLMNGDIRITELN